MGFTSTGPSRTQTHACCSQSTWPRQASGKARSCIQKGMTDTGSTRSVRHSCPKRAVPCAAVAGMRLWDGCSLLLTHTQATDMCQEVTNSFLLLH